MRLRRALCVGVIDGGTETSTAALALGHLSLLKQMRVLTASATTVDAEFWRALRCRQHAIFGELEFGVFNANGGNDAGTEFETGFQVSAGLGTYFTDEVFGALHLGYVELSSSDPGAGDLTDAGPFATVRLGYDLTPQDTVALSVSRYETSNAVTDGSGVGIQLGYFRRF